MYIGIDIGAGSIKAGLVDSENMVLARAVAPTRAESTLDASLSELYGCVDELLGKAGATVHGLGVGVPGAVDHLQGIVYNPPNMPAWKNVPLASLLQDHTGIETRIDNDANCAALGEGHFGAGRGCDNFIVLTLGTGVGAGIVLNRRIHHGTRGFAGEFGHITIDMNGPRCNCGNSGCIEAYIGIHHLMRDALPLLASDADGLLNRRAIEDPDSLEPRDISLAAARGDVTCTAVLRRAGSLLGVAIASAANLLDIVTFIVGGGISAAGAVLFDGIRDSTAHRVLSVHRENLRILPAKLGNDAGILGAATLLR